MRCLVTGATGHLGSYLLRILLKNGHSVAIVARNNSNRYRIEDILPQLKVIQGDLVEIDRCQSEILSFGPEAVFHVAWLGVTGAVRNQISLVRANLQSSLALLEGAIEAGCKIFVGIGSQAEYGPYDRAIREEFPCKPDSLYGLTKLCFNRISEKICELTNVRWLWLRLFATYGPKDHDSHLIPFVIQRLLNKEKPALTSGDQHWDYLYVEDAADAIYTAVFHSEVQGIYNLGSGEALPVKQVVTKIRNFIDPDLPLTFGEIHYRTDQLMHLQADISKIVADTSWRPKTNLTEGLNRTIDWYQQERRRLLSVR